MTAQEIHAVSGAYAVDALSETERAQFEAHLAQCAECRAEVTELQATTALLADLAPAAPPAAMRSQVLAGIRNVRPLPPPLPLPSLARIPSRGSRMSRLLAAATVLAVLAGGTYAWQNTSTDDSIFISASDRVLQATDAKRVNLQFEDGASASVVRSLSEGRAVLITRNMPPAPKGKIYEVWLQTPAGKMVPAATMDKAGDRTVLLEGDATYATAVGITVEPEGGSTSPTTKPVAVFKFEKAT